MLRVSLLLLILALVPAQAGILWEQSPNPGPTAYVDQEFPDNSGYSSYQVHDVTVGAGGWLIESIRGYYTYGWGAWPSGSASVRLNIFPKTGALPVSGDNPALGTLYTAVFSNDGSTNYVDLTGLSISLAPGDWWIGMTPILDFGSYRQEFHFQSTPVVGDYSAWRNPGGSFGYGTGWQNFYSGDGAIRIEGAAIPEPSTFFLLGLGAAALALLRRRAR